MRVDARFCSLFFFLPCLCGCTCASLVVAAACSGRDSRMACYAWIYCGLNELCDLKLLIQLSTLYGNGVFSTDSSFLHFKKHKYFLFSHALEIIGRHQNSPSYMIGKNSYICSVSRSLLVQTKIPVVALDASYPLIAAGFAHSKKANLFGIYTYMFFAT
jgi:hypothetical protein